MRPRRPLLVAALLAAAVAPACGPKGDPVRATLDGIARAVEKTDAEEAASHLAAGFRDAQGGDRNEALLTLRRYLAAYESLSVSLADVEVTRSADLARATFRADVSGTPRKLGGLDGWLPRSVKLRFELTLVPEGKEWKVSWASWHQEGGDPGP